MLEISSRRDTYNRCDTLTSRTLAGNQRSRGQPAKEDEAQKRMMRGLPASVYTYLERNGAIVASFRI